MKRSRREKWIATIPSEGTTWVYEGDVEGLAIWVAEELAKPLLMTEAQAKKFANETHGEKITIKRA